MAVRFHRYLWISLVIVLAATSHPSAERIHVLQRTRDALYIQPAEVPDSSLAARPRRRLFPFDGVSHRLLLRKRPVAGVRLLRAAASVDTVTVAVVRVAFHTDRDDELSSIRTGGGFDLIPGGTAVIDPTPHNRSYFDSHMTALENYLRFQSCGKLEIEWEVFPSGLDDSYKLSDIADYGPGRSGSWTISSLVRFFRDAVEIADGDIRYGDFDAIVVFHAGANLQSDVNFDTPNDIPSFFARLGDGDAFTVDGGETLIEDGSVVPETASQDGFYGGIIAVLAHEFGHQLGLPDLYNIYSNMPSVGVWDLMDSGGFLGAWLPEEQPGGDIVYHYAEGFIPSGFGGWARTFLGWTTVGTIRTFEELIKLPAVERCPARVAVVGAGTDEYFLIENRAAELDHLITGLVFDGNGVIIGTGNCLNCDDGVPEDPVWELVNGYDMLLPTEEELLDPLGGPGVLIWHADVRLIDERWATNELNTIEPFAVSLLEASGVVDLGDETSPFQLGWYDDAWYAGNNTVLGDETTPASWSNRGVLTGVHVEHISSRDTLMSFGAGVPDLVDAAVISGAIDVIPAGTLPIPDSERTLLIDREGRGWLAGIDTPVFDHIGSAVIAPLAWAPNFRDGIDVVVIGAREGSIHVLEDTYWTPLPGWPCDLGRYLATHPVVSHTSVGNFIAAADEAGRIHLIDDEGLEVSGSPIDLSGNILGNIVVASDGTGYASELYVLNGDAQPSPYAWLSGWSIDITITPPDTLVSLSSVPGYPQRITLNGAELTGEISLAGGDIDRTHEGNEVYIVAHETGRIFLCGAGLARLVRDRERTVTGTPAAYDLNGDGFVELIYADGSHLYAINPSGASLRGWPRRIGDYYTFASSAKFISPITVVSTAAGGLVAAGTDTGILFLYTADGGFFDGFPRKVSASLGGSVDILSTDGEGTFAFLDRFQYSDSMLVSRTQAPRGYYFKRRSLHVTPDIADGSWSRMWGGTYRTAFAPPAEGTAPAEKWLALADNLVVYPNPSRGERVGFHFTAPAQGDARLEIMTITGELVLERTKRLSGGEDEFVVSLSDRASGIYVCRLVVTAAGRQVQAMKKFAIVH